MALYSNLPVYKATYDLLIEFYRREDTIPRKYRYSIVDEIKRHLCDLLSMVYQANASQDKKPYLRQAMRDIEEVKIRVRILSDLHVLAVPRPSGASPAVRLRVAHIRAAVHLRQLLVP